jgi:hypothetical protein
MSTLAKVALSFIGQLKPGKDARDRTIDPAAARKATR